VFYHMSIPDNFLFLARELRASWPLSAGLVWQAGRGLPNVELNAVNTIKPFIIEFGIIISVRPTYASKSVIETTHADVSS